MTKYLQRVPVKDEVPVDRVVVHNHVLPTRRLGSRGFRAWLAPLDESLIVCDCNWAPELNVHYRIRKLHRR